MTFDQEKEQEAVERMQKSIPGKGNSKCKGPGAEECLMCSRSRGQAGVAGEESSEGKARADCGDLRATARTSSFTLGDVGAMAGC